MAYVSGLADLTTVLERVADALEGIEFELERKRLPMSAEHGLSPAMRRRRQQPPPEPPKYPRVWEDP